MRFLIDPPEVSRGPCLSAPLLAAPRAEPSHARFGSSQPECVLCSGTRESIYEDSIDAKALSPEYAGL